jgi:peptide/nickel transport system substrate-binding protein
MFKGYFRAFFALFALFAVGLLVACGGDDSDEDGDNGNGNGAATNTPVTVPAEVDKLTIGLSQLPEILDPRLGNPQTKLYLSLMFDHLVGVNPEGTEVSKETGVATSWESTDNKTWTFKLRQGYTFSNGAALTSADVKYSLEQLVLPESLATYAGTIRANLDGVDTPAPDTVVVRLKNASFQFPVLLSPLFGVEGMVLPKDYATAEGKGFATKPVGSGPYQLKSVTSGASISFERRAGTHPVFGTPRYKEIELRKIAEDGARRAALEASEVDVIDIDVATLDPEVLKKDGYTIFEKPQSNLIRLHMHEQNSANRNPVSNEKIRQALALAINKEEINKVVYRGLGVLSGTPIGSQAAGWTEFKNYPYDPEQAKKLLAEAGYDKTPIDLYTFAVAGVPGQEKAGEAIAGYWKNVGVVVNIKPIDFLSFRPLWFGKQLNGGANVLGTSQIPGGASYPNSTLGCTGQTSDICDPVVEQMLKDMQAAGALGNRQVYDEWIKKLNQYQYDHYTVVSLLEIGSFYAADPKVVPTGWKLGRGQFDYNISGLLLAK